jgi:anti-sigma regulatory factor (Ser/Thr protein kinase)
MAPPQAPDRVKIDRILRLHTDSSPVSLTDARRQVREAAAHTQLADKAVSEIEMMAGELLSNVHRHAYDCRVGPVFVELFQTPRMVTLVVIDLGDGSVAPAVPETLPSRHSVSGRGLYLVSRLSDELELKVNALGHGLAVRASKWLDGTRPGTARYHDAQVPNGAHHGAPSHRGQ